MIIETDKMNENMLTFKGISKSFGDSQVLNDVNISLNGGEFFTILGPSGSGKTTLLRICSGIETPTKGNVILNGIDITDLPPNKRKINTVFQDYALFPHMTVYENIIFGPRISGWDSKKILEESKFFLNLIQMSDYKNYYPHQLSGGQKQRVALARALINKPLVLLLDEPFAALDLKLRQRMVIELDTIHDEIGTIFLLVTHDQNEAMSISDRIAVLRNGCVEQIGSPTEIYEAPKNSFVAAFIGDINFFEGTVEEIINEDISSVMTNHIGKINVYNDKKLQNGVKIYLSIRPEKIRISKNKPNINPTRFNILNGIVEDVIYFGFQTKFWIDIGGYYISIIKQHNSYLLDETPIVYRDKVWIYWDPENGYLMDQYVKADEDLLTVPIHCK